ncbi:MAG: endonuclease domain-containing protein [Bacteroidetes bacterium]|nr:endonuclease domain-containing protein [Bacteroidota bacterium]
MKQRNLFNDKSLLDSRRELRNNPTPEEALLWDRLKNKQLQNRKFRRQHSIGNYILDFYCPSEMIAVELDGAHHFTTAGKQYDDERTLYLNEIGIRVLRFPNSSVTNDIEVVLGKICEHFKSSS